MEASKRWCSSEAWFTIASGQRYSQEDGDARQVASVEGGAAHCRVQGPHSVRQDSPKQMDKYRAPLA